MVIGTIIGASIFVQPSLVSGAVPSVSGMLLVWAVAGVLTLIGALVTAELASAFPGTGGVYVFLRESYSPSVAFPLVLGDVLEHAHRDHRGHRHGVSRATWVSSSRLAIPAYASSRSAPSSSSRPSTTLAFGTGPAVQTTFTVIKVAAVVLIAVVGFVAPHRRRRIGRP